MLLLGFLLIPTVLAGPTTSKVTLAEKNDYILEIDGSRTLKSIRSTEKSSDQLDLSSLDIRKLDDGVFNSLANLKSLNLANNSLEFVPPFAFRNLTQLEHLSLAENQIRATVNFFVGLENLKTLNLSNNLMATLSRGWLYGLTRKTDILLENNPIRRVDSDTFEESPGWFGPVRRSRSADDLDKVSKAKRDPIELEIATYNPFLSEPLRLKACIQDGSLSVVENIDRDDSLPDDCSRLYIEYNDQTLSLSDMNITKFEGGWYRLTTKQSPRIITVILNNNKVQRLTTSLLNDLPANVRSVSLARNEIQRVERGIMINRHIDLLDLSRNMISEIEDGAFDDMRLGYLTLADNRLKVIATSALPASLTLLELGRNEIAELPDNAFSKLVNVEHLCLAGNVIARLGKDSLQGLSSLRVLDLSDNGLNTIETGAFRHHKHLESVYLPNNSISSLEEGLFFDGPGPSLSLDLSSNKITNISKDTLPDLPSRLADLYLGENDIHSLEAGSFVNVPTSHLSLNSNKISKIARGSFDLPQLATLILSVNRLSNVDGESFEGLGRLEFLTLTGNGIERLNKGSMKNLGSLHTLDLTANPVGERLENGALYGLPKEPATRVVLSEGRLELLQGGLFDDA